MRLDQSFEVDAPLERVWSALLDIERVVPCIPGASVVGRNEDGTYEGSFKLKVGPVTANYAGKLVFESIDEASHTATMQLDGTDRRGEGGARATILSTLQADGDGTRIQVNTEYRITGRLARIGRGGMIEAIAEQVLTDFAQNLQALLQGEASGRRAAAEPDEAVSAAVEERPLDAGSLVESVAWQRTRSSPLVAAVIMGLMLLFALRLRRRH